MNWVGVVFVVVLNLCKKDCFDMYVWFVSIGIVIGWLMFFKIYLRMLVMGLLVVF